MRKGVSRMQRTERFIEINAPVERVFDLFSDFESFPRWMKNIREVRRTGRRYTRWAADAPLGSSVEWEAQITAFEPDRRIAWQSVRGDINTDGEVVYQESRRWTTLMRVRLGYDPPAGRLGSLVARLFGKNPEQQLEEDLERFAEVAEGRGRGRTARYDHAAFEERERAARRIARPERRTSGQSPRSSPQYQERDSRPGMRAGYGESRRRSDGADAGYSSTVERDERGRRQAEPREHPREALREARRRQPGPVRRDREESPRDGWRGRGARREPEFGREGRLAADLDWPDEQRREGSGRRRAADHWQDDEILELPPLRRYDAESSRPGSGRPALTPRERERERRRPRTDDDYPRQAFSRGVDKLMDDPPSSRWRR